jgi:quercetin dioxygenase-like cupin family protein
MFEKRSDSGYSAALAGICRKTLAYGEKTLMTEFKLQKGAALPRHSHPHEQTGYLVRGRIRLIIGNEKHEAHAGDSWCIPGGVEHGADILEDSVAIEVFRQCEPTICRPVLLKPSAYMVFDLCWIPAGLKAELG